jgi:transglutaminase-like putative cysteine protease
MLVRRHHPGLGWFDFDPTNNHCPDDRHITVAWGRDYGDVTPLKGVVSAAASNRQPCRSR